MFKLYQNYNLKTIMLKKLNTKNPLKMLFIFIYKIYEGKKSEGGIEYFSATTVFLVLLSTYFGAITEFLGIAGDIFKPIFKQNKLVAFIIASIVDTSLYFFLKLFFSESEIVAINLSKKEKIIGECVVWLLLIFGFFLCFIAINYNKCESLTIYKCW